MKNDLKQKMNIKTLKKKQKDLKMSYAKEFREWIKDLMNNRKNCKTI